MLSPVNFFACLLLVSALVAGCAAWDMRVQRRVRDRADNAAAWVTAGLTDDEIEALL